MFGGKFPDITPIQVVAVVGSVIAILVAYGVNLSTAQQDSIMDLVKIVAPLLVVGDAAVRGARNYRAAKVESAKAINGAPVPRQPGE
jgi:hypothetical protein